MPGFEPQRPTLPTHCQVEPNLRLDCRFYRGDRPCSAGVQGVCPTDCPEHTPFGKRILIIKLAALGDVVRTLALLPGIKDAWTDSFITWITRPSGVRMLANHPLIDRLLPFDAESLAHLECERFDLCLSLDKEPAPAALAMRIDAAEKRGIGLSAHGTVFPLNAECRHYFRLGLDDELKYRRNEKSYQELVYDAVGLRYRGQRYRLYPNNASRARAARIWTDLGLEPTERVVGLNTGAGRGFANKTWPPGKFVELARALIGRGRFRVALLGGPDEIARNRRIAAACPGALDIGCDHSELDFVALMERCGVLLTGDSLAVHVAVACEVPCVVLFGPTCAQEIELYGRGTKVRTPLQCSPCYRRTCDISPSCMDEISVERVLAAVDRWAAAPFPQRAPLAVSPSR